MKVVNSRLQVSHPELDPSIGYSQKRSHEGHFECRRVVSMGGLDTHHEGAGSRCVAANLITYLGTLHMQFITQR